MGDSTEGLNVPDGWEDVPPCPQMVSALDGTDGAPLVTPRSDLLNRWEDRQQPTKKWSGELADQCAHMVSNALSSNECFAHTHLIVQPDRNGPAEPLVLAADKTKKVDVVVRSNLGLMMGLSLKGYNFRDPKQFHFGKNLTGRTYELESELRAVREVIPLSRFGGIHFLPMAAAFDAGPKSSSTFAKLVARLRTETRPERRPYEAVDWHRPDFSMVCLYSGGDHEEPRIQPDGSTFAGYEDPLQRGVVGYFDVEEVDPPGEGLPPHESALDLNAAVERMAQKFRSTFNF